MRGTSESNCTFFFKKKKLNNTEKLGERINNEINAKCKEYSLTGTS